MISPSELLAGGTSRWRPGWLVLGAAAVGLLAYGMARRSAGSDRARSSGHEQRADPSPAEARVTANERSDGVRRTGDDRLVHPVAAGETDPVAAADPTVAQPSPPGQPTG